MTDFATGGLRKIHRDTEKTAGRCVTNSVTSRMQPDSWIFPWWFWVSLALRLSFLARRARVRSQLIRNCGTRLLQLDSAHSIALPESEPGAATAQPLRPRAEWPSICVAGERF